ncbi:MAG TPA: NAD(P)-binding domain-containing protein, partial [Candidatus Sulfotelmatobacter sp.]
MGTGRRIAEAGAPSAMLPGMASKPVVAIVGAGNFGTALAVALRRAGYSIEAVIARPRSSSLRKAQKLAKQIRAQVSTDPSALHADVIWFCLPDAKIAQAARSFADKLKWKGRVA